MVRRYFCFGQQFADFSEDLTYRYALGRRLGDGNKSLNFIMLNPSTADQKDNDPTVSRCIERGERMGFDFLTVTNLFAYRSTNPDLLNKVDDPVGSENDKAILDAAFDSAIVVCAWGGSTKLIKSRAKKVVKMLRDAEIKLHYLKMSKGSGQPWHPLYLSYSEEPKEWLES